MKKVKVGKSEIHGNGLFADEPIKRGDIIELVHTMREIEPGVVKTTPTLLGRNYNHSDDANALNVIDGNNRYLVALKEIKPGGEITTNYRTNPDLEQPDSFSSNDNYISFDYDDTLTTPEGFKLAQQMNKEGKNLYVITARDKVTPQMIERAEAAGIPRENIITAGSDEAKVKIVKESNISKHIDNKESVIKALGDTGELFAPDNYPDLKADFVEMDLSDDDLNKLKEGGFIVEEYSNGGEPGDKFKKRLMKRYPGMQGVYGPEGENLNIVKDPNYDARSVGYGDIEFSFPGDDPILNYPNLIEAGAPDYNYPNPSPDKYTALYNPKGANRGDVFLDMMHGMRDDPNFQPLLQNFEKAVKDTRGEDMNWQYEGEVENGSTQSKERFDENYVDGQLRAQLAPRTIGMFSHGRKDYRMERKYDSPEMREAGKDIRQYLKGKYSEGGIAKFPDGGEPKERKKIRFAPGGYDPNETAGYILEEQEVPVTAQASNWGKARTKYKEKHPEEEFINKKKRQYLKNNKNLIADKWGTKTGYGNKNAISSYDWPDYLVQNFKNEYDYKTNTAVVKSVSRQEGWNPNDRTQYVDDLNDTQRNIVAESKYGNKLQPSYWARTLGGLGALASKFSPEVVDAMNKGNIPGLTKKESQEILNAKMTKIPFTDTDLPFSIPVGGLESLSFLEIPGTLPANYLKNTGLSSGSSYKEMPSWYSGEKMANVTDADVTAFNPLTYAGIEAIPELGINALRTGVKGLKSGYQIAKELKDISKPINISRSFAEGVGSAKNLLTEARQASMADDVNFYKTKGPIGKGTGTKLTEADIQKAIDKNKEWITSTEYAKRRAANTGESLEEIQKSVDKTIKAADNATYKLNTSAKKMDFYDAEGMMSHKKWWRPAKVEISSKAVHPLQTLEHEVKHLYSPAIFDNRKVYKNYPAIDAEDYYLTKGPEQQVRHLNARQQILEKNNLPIDAQLSEEQIADFVDEWRSKMNKRKKSPDDFSLHEDYDDLWSEQAGLIQKEMLKDKYNTEDLDFIGKLPTVQKIKFMNAYKDRLNKVIGSALNNAWMTVPVAGGLEMINSKTPEQRYGGSINKLNKFIR